MSDKHDLKLLLQGHVPIIHIETHEELRSLDLLKATALNTYTPIFKWTVTEGLQRLDIQLDSMKLIAEPEKVLRHIKATDLSGIYILLDFHHYINDPMNQRLIKEIALEFEISSSKLVFISTELALPRGLDRLSINFHLRLPNREELEKIIHEEADAWSKKTGKNVRADKKALDRLIQNLSGLPHRDAKRIIRSAIVDDNAITESDLPMVMDAKYKLLNQGDLLAYEYETTDFSEIGGMKRLKDWLMQRHLAFSSDKELPKGLNRPKGILLLGVQGCGKSLTAKAVAGVWGLPLLRMDFGRLYNKYIGETEKNIRDALHMAEVIAPCVLWIDEIEKGISSGNEDDGTSKRILSTLLTWMAENKHSVFIVATANQIHDLPPELIRKGRLDEIFFVDLPDMNTREKIFSIHLMKRDIPVSNIDMSLLARESNGFSGSEIEQAIVSVIYASLSSRNDIDTQMVLDELVKTRPLSIVMSEKIDQLRLWAKDRTVPVD